MKPLNFSQMAEVIGDSTADIELGGILNKEKIRQHSYLDGKVERVIGKSFDLELPLEYQHGKLHLQSKDVLSKKIRRIVLLNPNAEPWGEDGSFWDSKEGNEFKRLMHNEIAKLATVDRLQYISYQNVTTEEIRKMNYELDTVSLSWEDKNGRHEYSFP